MIRGNGVQISRVAKAFQPIVLVPAVPQYPCPPGGMQGALGNPLQAFLLRRGFAINLLQAERIVLQVDVGVGQSWDDGAPT
jgi:hypothetical protein